jgi:hypothetical protein
MERRVHTIIAKNPKDMAAKYKEFEKTHTIVDVKYPTPTMILVFYEESFRFKDNGVKKIEQERMADTGRKNAY